jgi:predicted alpha/beta-fold hydrolase
MISVLGLSSSIVIFTDSLYVYEYGRRFGCSLFILSSMLAIRCAVLSSSSVSTILHRCTISVLIVVAIVIYLQSDGSTSSNINNTTIASAAANMTPYSIFTSSIKNNPLQQISHPGIDLPTFNDGLYYSKSNNFIQSIISHWPLQSRTYTTTNGSATPYLVNGDQRTGIPFIVNKVTPQEYVRVYVQNMYDDEYLALDIAFPYKFSNTNNHTINTTTSDDTTNATVVQLFIHDITKPVYLLLHGLNGGSHEQYVMDMVNRRRHEGSTVIVFIARGMMDTTITTWNTFHGARTGDIDIVARSVRAGLDSLALATNVLSNQRQLLAGVGYSMGAIILSNYVSRSGNHCALDTAMAISGGLDMRQQINAKRSIRLWQPILTLGLRQDILLGKYGRHYKSRLSKEQMFGLLRATSISELDVEAIVTYNSFTSLIHYYSEMSAMGDRDPEFNLLGRTPTTVSSSSNEWGRIGNVSIPFVVLQALDDPIVGWRTVGTSNPQSLVDSGLGNVILLLTKAGGHVGWPIGINPAVSSWQWMNNAARDFVIATDIARSEI